MEVTKLIVYNFILACSWWG